MPGVHTSPRPARQRKLTEKARELFEWSEYVNGESDYDGDVGCEQGKGGGDEYEESAASDAGNDQQVAKAAAAQRKRGLTTPHMDVPTSDSEELDGSETVLSAPTTPKKKTSASDRRKATMTTEDLVEVVVLSKEQKKKKNQVEVSSHDDEPSLLDSPLKRMSVYDSPVSPQSPSKRKRVTRTVTPDSEDTGGEASFEEACLRLKAARKGDEDVETPKKRMPKSNPGEESEASPLTPKAKKASPVKAAAGRAKQEQASPKKKPAPCKKDPETGEDRAEDEDQQVGSSSSRKNKTVVWSQDELNAIGDVYTAAMIAVQPSACREALQKVWERKNIPPKTSMELNNHLRKWKKTYSVIPSTFWA